MLQLSFEIDAFVQVLKKFAVFEKLLLSALSILLSDRHNPSVFHSPNAEQTASGISEGAFRFGTT